MLLCPKCRQSVPDDALVCPVCKALVHAQDYERLTAEAERFEHKRRPRAARETWLKALALVPPESEHADWIRQHAAVLLSQYPNELNRPKSKWSKWLAPLSPIAVALAKVKTLLLAIVKLKSLLSLIAFVGVYWAVWGPKFGIGFAALILIHEMGHFIDVKRRGLPAEMPVFLPGLGAYVKWQALGVSTETRAAVSLAGPLAGLLASVTCAVIWWKTGDPLWAGLTRIGAWLNALNLVPVWILDGGTAVTALGRAERFILLAAGLALWLILGEVVFFLVAAGAGLRIFTKDAPPKSSAAIAAYYLAVIVCLGLVLRAVPVQPITR